MEDVVEREFINDEQGTLRLPGKSDCRPSRIDQQISQIGQWLRRPSRPCQGNPISVVFPETERKPRIPPGIRRRQFNQTASLDTDFAK
jgi:hypothetical protein